MPDVLSDREKAVIDFEGSWWSQPGSKAALIRSRLGLSPSRYYEILSALAHSRPAAAYDPLVVSRLRRDRTRRRRALIEGRPAQSSQPWVR